MVGFIDAHRDAHGVEPICAVLPIAPSTYYERLAKRVDPTRLSDRARRDVALRPEIRRVFAENWRVYGVRKVWRQLVREGFDVARCTVARLMRDMGIQGIIRGKTHRCVVRMDRRAVEDVPADRLGQRLQKGRTLAHPLGERRAVQVDAVALEDLALTVERKVVAVLADEHMGEQAGPRPAALDGTARQRRLREGLAPPASEARAHDAGHDEAAGHVLQLLGDVLADPTQSAAACGAIVPGGAQLDLCPRHVVGNWPSPGLVLRRLLEVGQPQLRDHRGGRQFARLQRQLQLLGRLSGGAEPMRAVSGQLMAELLDEDGLRLHFGDQARRQVPQIVGIVGERGGLVKHVRILLDPDPSEDPLWL